MHPNPLFRSDDRALLETLIDEIGFGMIFAATPDGPRVAHTPVLRTAPDRLQFHIARGNALTRHLDGAILLAVINGPDSYVSPRWYENRATVPTWDYVALELDGRATRLDDEALDALLYELIERHESRLGGDRWSAAESPPQLWDDLRTAIVGFELEILAWRPTIKLSQNKNAAERARIAEGLEAAGSSALARLMLDLAP